MHHDTPPHDGHDDKFWDIVDGFGAPEVATPSLDEQELTFLATLGRFRQAWHTSRLIDKILDRLPDGEDYMLVLEKRTEPEQGYDQPLITHSIVIVKELAPKRPNTPQGRYDQTFITVSVSVGATSMPQGSFTQADCVLIAAQISELEQLREQGLLPNLQQDLTRLA